MNDNVSNGLGTPVGYKLVPTAAFPPLLDPASGLPAGQGDRPHALGDPYRQDERWPCGDFPVQADRDTGLPIWTEADRPIENTDVVLWYVFGIHHLTRPEDWPVMPVDVVSFWLKPFGFFDRNPALDVPQPPLGVAGERGRARGGGGGGGGGGGRARRGAGGGRGRVVGGGAGAAGGARGEGRGRGGGGGGGGWGAEGRRGAGGGREEGGVGGRRRGGRGGGRRGRGGEGKAEEGRVVVGGRHIYEPRVERQRGEQRRAGGGQTEGAGAEGEEGRGRGGGGRQGGAAAGRGGGAREGEGRASRDRRGGGRGRAQRGEGVERLGREVSEGLGEGGG